uniref:Uncharacterized protein n=1 Tax=Marseillevirus LCMAC103 TaxID=2506604 RepID=A0A481YV32_9VIRU|nr:MAG: uncharacterized protein LCMAC103_02380 [Marseillevirus LCMAC103]
MSIGPQTIENLRKSVLPRLLKLTFRRVKTVVAQELYAAGFHTGGGHVRLDNLAAVSPAEWDRNVELRHHSYHGFTSPARLRSNDKHPDTPVHFSRQNFAHFDPVTLTLTTYGEEAQTARGLGDLYRKTADAGLFDHGGFVTQPLRDVAPREGDLLCGHVASAAGKARPFFEKWFTCSEQFYRAWTLIVHEAHDSFGRAERKKSGARAYWLSGNRLMTNNYAKWRLGCIARGTLPSDAECRAQYWHPRTELASRYWIHLYCALVLLLRYGEMPTPENVPMNRNDPHAYARWNFFPGFVESFVAFHNVHGLLDEKTAAPEAPAPEAPADEARPASTVGELVALGL